MKPLHAPAPPVAPVRGAEDLDGEAKHLSAGEIPGGGDHEELLVARGSRSGATMAIAVHSTALGPAVGGLRIWHYERDEDAISDVLRLSAAMTRKAAVAGLELGGGKAVVSLPTATAPAGQARRDVLLDIADLIESLDGRYLTAEDVGTRPSDMAVIAERTSHVTGIEGASGSGDPSPFTAIGVEAAMRAACRAKLGRDDLAGMRVTVVGVGHVGGRLARSLAAAGAQLTLSDADPAKAELANELGAGWAAPEDAITTPCDVVAPCAVGGAINAGNVEELDCEVICGAANNQLDEPWLDRRLAERRILFTPDYVANAGGLISIYGEMRGYGADRAGALALAIEDAVGSVLELAEFGRTTPLEAAETLARRRLAAA